MRNISSSDTGSPPLLQPSMYVKLSVLGALNGGSGVIELSGAKLLAATALGEATCHK